MSTSVRINHADLVMDRLRELISSDLPALVFTSLAALSVPVFSDRCQIVVDEDDLAVYRIERPILSTSPAGSGRTEDDWVRDAWSGQWVSEHAVRTSFAAPATATTAGFRGAVVHLWNRDYHPTGTDLALAQTLVDHAVAMLRREQGRPPPSS